MKPAEECHEIAEGLYCWQAYDPSVKTDLTSTAIRHGGKLLFIDPIPLAEEPLAQLARLGPGAILITSANHQRAAAAFRERFSIPIWSAADLECGVDRRLEEGEVVEGLEIIRLAGVVAGEMAIHSPRGRGAMMMGDALIHLEPTGFAVLPRKYCEEPKRARESLQKLLHFAFDLMTFAHGLPIVSGARERLQALLQ